MATLQGDDNANQITGTGEAETLHGHGGSDTLMALGGADLLFGGAGNDALVGGAGADTLEGGEGIDQVAYFLDGGSLGVTVDLSAGTAIDSFGTVDTLSGIEQVHGTALDDRLTGGAGSDLLYGREGNDLLRGLGGAETLVGGAGNDTLDGGTGNDQVAYFLEGGSRGVVADLRAGTATDTHGGSDTLISVEYVHGSNRADTLLGTDGDGDRLFGRDGDDYIDGRDGNNLIYTGAGNDHVVVGTTAAEARDTVVINGYGDKLITGAGAAGSAYGHHIVFDLDEGVVVNLATGIARSANMTLDFSQALHFLEVGGTSFDDHLIGGNPAHDYLEWFSGNQGNDTIDGGSGTANTVIYDDEVRYGAFDHTKGVQEFGTRGVVVNLATGVATDSFGFTDTLINIDAVRATKFADNLTGNAQANEFWGLEGNDTLNGGAGSDRAHYRADSVTGGMSGVIVDLVAGLAIDGFGAQDRLISIEEAYGSDFDDRIRGDTADNRLFGYDGDDSLAGAAGRDTLDGGIGNDTVEGGIGDDELWGGAGDDRLDGGAGHDIARYLDATSGIVADLAAGQAADGMGGTDTLTGIEGIYGSQHSDTLRGDGLDNTLAGLGGNDVIQGGGGADTLIGGAGNDRLEGGAGDDQLWGEAGNDTLDGGEGSDLVRYRNATAGIAIDLAAGGGGDGLGGTDGLTGIENLDGSDFGDRMTGNAAANRLFGFAGDDTIAGGGGNDTLTGAEGDDSLSGGIGDDELHGGAGNDTLDGGEGNDLVRYRSVTGSVRADLETGVAIDGEGGTDLLLGIEHVDGSDQADVLRGNDAANRLFGFAGSDVIEGRGGDDILLGGAGENRLYGGDGNDQLWGESAADTLDGGAGSDLVRYRNATGAMTISLADGTATEAGGATDLLISIENADGSDQDDILTGNAAANRLFGFAGRDTIAGGTGEDVLVGGAGGDLYHYRAGDGYDVVNDLGDVGGPADRVILHDYLPDKPRVYQAGNNVVLDFGTSRDVLVLAGALVAGGNSIIEYIEFADGTVWDHATLLSKIGQPAGPSVVPPTAGNDTLFGTPDADAIDGGAGHDMIHGMAGRDTLSGGEGNDTIRAGDGDDLVDGGAGDDLLVLGAGADTVTGGAGHDIVVFDASFAAIGGDYMVEADGTAVVGGNRISGVEMFRFSDRDIRLAELRAMAENEAPVSTLPAAIATDEGAQALDLAQWFSDAEGDTLVFSVSDLPAGIVLQGSVLTGLLEAALPMVPHTVTVTVADGIHELRQSLDWTVRNLNAAPTGVLALEGDAVTGQVLRAASTLADADGIDPATLTHAWLRNGVAIPGATGDSYTLTAADLGARISLRVGWTDLFGTAEAVVSAATPPVAAAALFLTGTAGHDELRGGPGNDTLNGLDGPDVLEGQAGDDSLLGGDGADTLIGGTGDDFLFGGSSEADLRDAIYGGAGNDYVEGGYGNDELRGDGGNDAIAGGFGADLVIGGAGNDTLTGSALGDEIHGGDGDDFVNGGFGHDRVNGGAGADAFYHLGIADHGSDWVQDYDAAEGDVLRFGQPTAARAQFQVNFTETARAGVAGVEEAFVIYRPTGQIVWALVDGGAQTQINLEIGGRVYDLLA